MITEQHVREAIAIAQAGGTAEHPYRQSQWGASECGTPCCVWGHACLLAGVKPDGPSVTHWEKTPYTRRIARLARCSFDGILRIMAAVNDGGGIDFSEADLRGANLSKVDLSEADLSGANLNYAALSRADLSGANLREADLDGANLSEANLSDANLSDADLRGADLRNADLRNADLRNASLRNADLRNASLRGANLEGADLRGAKRTDR